MSKYFKRKKGKEIQQQTPRTLEEIQKVNGELLARAANAQYMVYIYGRELNQLNEQLMYLNQEAGARKQLDAKLQATEATSEQP